MCAANSVRHADCPSPYSVPVVSANKFMRYSAPICFVGLTAALCASTTLVRAESQKSNKDFDYYISTRGDDNWSGQLSEPNAARTNGPLATLEKAKSKVRAERLKKPAAKIRVALRGGDYRLSKTMVFSMQDSAGKEG